MKTNLRTLTLFLPMILASCTSSETVASGEPVNDINKTITLTAPTEINTFKLNDFISIAVQNNSDHQILLLPENSIDITMMSKGQSTDIPNSLNSSNSKVLLSPKSQKETSLTLFTVIPNIPAHETVTIRIMVKGVDQTTNQEVSGYIDITLKP